MSDAFYENLRDSTAGPLIEKYGMALTLTRTVPGISDENAGTVGAGTTAVYPCFGLVEDYDVYVLSKSLVRSGEKKLLLSAKGLPITPAVGDRFEMPDGIWFIPDGDGDNKMPPVKPLSPAGIVVLYTIRIRQ